MERGSVEVTGAKFFVYLNKQLFTEVFLSLIGKIPPAKSDISTHPRLMLPPNADGEFHTA